MGEVLCRAGRWLPEAVAEETRSRLALLRVEHALLGVRYALVDAQYGWLVAATRAAVAAAAAGDPDPVGPMRAGVGWW